MDSQVVELNNDGIDRFAKNQEEEFSHLSELLCWRVYFWPKKLFWDWESFHKWLF
jgi:hypothetical protein